MDSAPMTIGDVLAIQTTRDLAWLSVAEDGRGRVTLSGRDMA